MTCQHIHIHVNKCTISYRVKQKVMTEQLFARVNICANSAEEIKVFYCLTLKNRARNKEKVGEEIRNFGQNIHTRYLNL